MAIGLGDTAQYPGIFGAPSLQTGKGVGYANGPTRNLLLQLAFRLQIRDNNLKV
jgi:hypothetical protein